MGASTVGERANRSRGIVSTSCTAAVLIGPAMLVVSSPAMDLRVLEMLPPPPQPATTSATGSSRPPTSPQLDLERCIGTPFRAPPLKELDQIDEESTGRVRLLGGAFEVVGLQAQRHIGLQAVVKPELDT